jgi:hypothetical protein
MKIMVGTRRHWGALLAVALWVAPAGAARERAAQGTPVVAEVAKVRKTAGPFAIEHPLPFKFGEHLTFDVKFSRFPVYANVGQVNFTVNQPNNNDRHIRFQVEAVSRGALAGMFGVTVHDVFTTLADRDDLYVYSTIKSLHEGERRFRQEAVFDRTARSVRHSTSNPAAPSEPPAVTTAETPVWVQDAVSAFYFARTRDLTKQGQEVSFDINDEAKTYNIGVVPVARERIKTGVGTFQTIKVDVRIFKGRFLRREGQLFVWMTDDARRIPVKARLKIPAGTVTFDMTRLEEGKLPIESSPPLKTTGGEAVVRDE